MKMVASRWTRVLAVTIVALLSVSVIPGMVFKSPVVDIVEAADETYVKVGWVSEVQNWNPTDLAMVEDWVACFLMYSALWQFDEKWDKPVGDLALSWNTTIHPDDTMTLWINITDTAYFRNIQDTGIDSTDHPLTADDVAWGFNLMKTKTACVWEWYLRDYENITAVDETTVRMDIPYIKATLIDDLTGIPVIPRFHFEDLGTTWMNSFDPEDCIGSSAFVFEDDLPGSWYKFKKAPNYHGEADYGSERSIKFDGILYDLSTNEGEMVISMNGGELDAIALTGAVRLYEDELGVGTEVPITKQAVQELGICDIALNAIPYEFRVDEQGSANDWGISSNPEANAHLQDREVRKAILMTLNKSYICDVTMGGLATEADSVIWPGFWQADITGVLPYDPDDARQVLLDAGYYDDGGTYLKAGPTSYVVQKGWVDEGSELSGIRCHAPNTDASWEQIVDSWRGWAEDAGIGLDSDVVQEAIMTNEEWYKADFDIWVWHWGWGPEPTSDLSVWLTEEMTAGGDNCEGPMGPWWYGPNNYTEAPTTWNVDGEIIEYELEGPYSAFDQNFTIAKHTIDINDRKVILDKLQQWIYDSYTETPPYYDVGLYGFSTANFQGWGDWTTNSGRTIVSGMIWLWYDLIPGDNLRPVIDVGLASGYEAELDVDQPFTIRVHDPEGDDLMVNWTFGDGTERRDIHTGTEDPFDITVTHTYTELENDLELVVTVTDGLVGHTVSSSSIVDVVVEANAVPSIVDLDFPIGTSYVGETTSWSVTATDKEATELTITWDWGDGSSTTHAYPVGTAGAEVTDSQDHVYDYAWDYEVVVYVYDGYELSDLHNVSQIVKTHTVIENTAPTDPVIGEISTNADTWTPCIATSTDADPDTLEFTWEWGDGTDDNVTEDTPEQGNTAVSIAWHSWTDPGTYLVNVTVDDQNDHFATTQIEVVVAATGPLAPGSIMMIANPNPGTIAQEIEMNFTAADGDGDALTIYVEFGDDTDFLDTTDGGTVGLQYVLTTHTYVETGIFDVTVHVDDGTFNESSVFQIEVLDTPENSPPVFYPSSAYSAMYNETFTIKLVNVIDVDGDELTAWYDWGDETEVTEGDAENDFTATHVYHATGEFILTISVDDNTGIGGHNESKTAKVLVDKNLRPKVVATALEPAKTSYAIGETVTFTITVNDTEGDPMVVKIVFGDSDEVFEANAIPSGPKANVIVNFTHAYTSAGDYDLQVWAEDDKDHPDPEWLITPISITIDAPPPEDDESNILFYVGLALLAIIIVAVVAMLMKKRKGGAEKMGEESGGMEGMQPPVEPEPDLPEPPQVE